MLAHSSGFPTPAHSQAPGCGAHGVYPTSDFPVASPPLLTQLAFPPEREGCGFHLFRIIVLYFRELLIIGGVAARDQLSVLDNGVSCASGF